jgi:hypothetical protein
MVKDISGVLVVIHEMIEAVVVGTLPLRTVSKHRPSGRLRLHHHSETSDSTAISVGEYVLC